MKRYCIFLLVAYLFIAGYVQGFAFSKDDLENEASEVHKPTQTDEDQIIELRDQVTKLQQSVDDITRSFSALESVVNSLVKNLVESPKARVERDVDQQPPQSPTSPSPTSSSPSSDNSDPNPASDGSFVCPVLSGHCFTCPAGVPGPMGPPGPQGIMGRDGRDGRDAVTQPQVEEPSCDPTSRPEIQPVGNSSQSGVTYIRWGSSECPENAELIYRGTVGGAHYTNTGGGANYLCMPDEPIYDEVVTSEQNERARVYSSEYQTDSAPSRLQSRHDDTPTCAVCRAPSGRSTKLMIPARNVCPSEDWRLEYAGYLMAQQYNHQRTEYVCVDREMDYEPGTQGNQNGVLLYLVEGRCLSGGGLHCGPYVNGYELTCAVCTI